MMKFKTALIIIGAISLLVIFFIVKLKYKRHQWSRTIAEPEHQLEVGSFIFSKTTGSNGSQSSQNYYHILKVVRIDKDYVKLAVVRQLSNKDKEIEGDFTTSAEEYEKMKTRITSKIVTGIPLVDLHAQGGDGLHLTKYLTDKYPDLLKSRYYYEDVSPELKNKLLPTDQGGLQDYIVSVYSAEHIKQEGKLVPYSLTNINDGVPYLANQLSKSIDLIVNKK